MRLSIFSKSLFPLCVCSLRDTAHSPLDWKHMTLIIFFCPKEQQCNKTEGPQNQKTYPRLRPRPCHQLHRVLGTNHRSKAFKFWLAFENGQEKFYRAQHIQWVKVKVLELKQRGYLLLHPTLCPIASEMPQRNPRALKNKTKHYWAC